MKKFTVTEDTEVVLDGKKYLLEAGDKIVINEIDERGYLTPEDEYDLSDPNPPKELGRSNFVKCAKCGKHARQSVLVTKSETLLTDVNMKALRPKFADYDIEIGFDNIQLSDGHYCYACIEPVLNDRDSGEYMHDSDTDN